MSQEDKKEIEKVPRCLAKRYEILERLVKDIADSTASASENANACRSDCGTSRLCALLETCKGRAGRAEKPPSRVPSCPRSPEKVASYRQDRYLSEIPQKREIPLLSPTEQMPSTSPLSQVLPTSPMAQMQSTMHTSPAPTKSPMTQMPQIAQMAQMPQRAQIPQMAQMPQMPPMSQMPPGAQMTPMAQMPMMPPMVQVPLMSQIPQMPVMSQMPQMQPMPILTQAPGCTCKPGTRETKTMDQVNKMDYKKRMSYLAEHRAEIENWMEIDDFNQFGRAIANELLKRNKDQADMLKHKIATAVLGLDDEMRKSRISADQSYVAPFPKYLSRKFSTPYEDWQKYQNAKRTSTLQSEAESLSRYDNKRGSVPFYSSKSQIFEYNRKEEFGSPELVLDVESSLSIDVNDTGEELIEWPQNDEDEEQVSPEVLEEIKKEVEENLKQKKRGEK